jgi:hypothetical protein
MEIPQEDKKTIKLLARGLVQAVLGKEGSVSAVFYCPNHDADEIVSILGEDNIIPVFWVRYQENGVLFHYSRGRIGGLVAGGHLAYEQLLITNIEPAYKFYDYVVKF